MKALTAAEMREVDRLTTERFGISSGQLMENAGAAVADFVRHEISRRFDRPVRKIVVLCGKGNNGGDGFVAARLLRQELRYTTVILFAAPAELKGDSALNFQRWRDAGGQTIVVDSEPAWSSIAETSLDADVILDAMLGTGLKGVWLRPHCKNDRTLKHFLKKGPVGQAGIDCGDRHPLRYGHPTRWSFQRSVAIRAQDGHVHCA